MSTNRAGVGGFGWLSTGDIPGSQGTRKSVIIGPRMPPPSFTKELTTDDLTPMYGRNSTRHRIHSG